MGLMCVRGGGGGRGGGMGSRCGSKEGAGRGDFDRMQVGEMARGAVRFWVGSWS